MDGLKPCPFCGGEATESNHYVGYIIECEDCEQYGHGAYVVSRNKAEAIEAWNTRAEYHGYEQAAIEAWQSIKAFKERTCELVPFDGQTVFGKCSECHSWIHGKMNYCSNCGARVTPKNSETTPKVVSE